MQRDDGICPVTPISTSMIVEFTKIDLKNATSQEDRNILCKAALLTESLEELVQAVTRTNTASPAASLVDVDVAPKASDTCPGNGPMIITGKRRESFGGQYSPAYGRLCLPLVRVFRIAFGCFSRSNFPAATNAGNATRPDVPRYVVKFPFSRLSVLRLHAYAGATYCTLQD